MGIFRQKKGGARSGGRDQPDPSAPSAPPPPPPAAFEPASVPEPALVSGPAVPEPASGSASELETATVSVAPASEPPPVGDAGEITISFDDTPPDYAKVLVEACGFSPARPSSELFAGIENYFVAERPLIAYFAGRAASRNDLVRASRASVVKSNPSSAYWFGKLTGDLELVAAAGRAVLDRSPHLSYAAGRHASDEGLIQDARVQLHRTIKNNPIAVYALARAFNDDELLRATGYALLETNPHLAWYAGKHCNDSDLRDRAAERFMESGIQATDIEKRVEELVRAFNP